MDRRYVLTFVLCTFDANDLAKGRLAVDKFEENWKIFSF